MAGAHPTDRQGGEGFREGEVQSLCPVCQARAGHQESASVHEGVDVVVEGN